MIKNKSIVGIVIICVAVLLYLGHGWLNQTEELAQPTSEVLVEMEKNLKD